MTRWPRVDGSGKGEKVVCQMKEKDTIERKRRNRKTNRHMPMGEALLARYGKGGGGQAM